MPWHRKASAKTQVSLRKFLQSEVKIIHSIVQDQDGQNNNNIREKNNILVNIIGSLSKNINFGRYNVYHFQYLAIPVAVCNFDLFLFFLW